MNNSSFNSFIGWLFIIVGCVVLVAAAGELLVRILIAAGAFLLIKQGLQLNGISLTRLAMQLWFKRRF